MIRQIYHEKAAQLIIFPGKPINPGRHLSRATSGVATVYERLSSHILSTSLNFSEKTHHREYLSLPVRHRCEQYPGQGAIGVLNLVFVVFVVFVLCFWGC